MNNNFENNLNETQFEDMRQQLNTPEKETGRAGNSKRAPDTSFDAESG